MSRQLSEILCDISVIDRMGPEDAAITGLAYDSRAVQSGFLFFALSGLHEDGHRFIDQAIEKGAAAIVHSSPIAHPRPGIAYIRVVDPRFSMSPISAVFYGRPSRSLGVIAVTGTEGKSTTVYLAYQLLNLAGRRSGFFSTVMSDTGGGETPNPEHQTTPEATAVQRMLAEMRDAGMKYAVVEASSHGLSPRTNRLGDVDFDVGVMTNVTSDHLEFHGSWEQYRDDKANLFRRLRSGGLGIVNADDPSAGYFREVSSAPVRSFSASGAESDLSAHSIAVDALGQTFEAVEVAHDGRPRRVHVVRANLPGAFNVGNVLAALLAVSHIARIDIADLVSLVPKLKPVRGRMTRIDRGQAFEVVVDYAHTPSSFETIFPPLRERVTGRMICVFGSGGERDRQKRPRQGRIAADWCDIVILADEDPRGEDPMELLEEIAAGCPELPRGERLFLIPDRPTAIRTAFSLARPGDLVALLGKGHENSIIGKNGPVPYDEIDEAIKALAELGY